MRALRVHELTGPDGLLLEEVDEPAEQDGLVLVDVDAVGIGFVDLLTTRGQYQLKPPPPFTPASELVGRRRDTGERVIALAMFSALAEVAPALGFALFPVPDALSDEQAAALPINYQTAHLALVRRGRMRAGEAVLVHGAAGGVGSAAIQVARALEASQVIAVASTDDKRQAAREAGATHVLDAGEDWVAAVKELTDGRGADLVVDPVGGDAFHQSLRCMAPFGRLLVIGFASGTIPEVKVNRLLLRHHDVVGVNFGGMLPIDQRFALDAHADLMRWFEQGHVRPLVGSVHDLADGAQAFRDLESRTVVGKPVVRVSR
ncbi:NADPH:quinone oxidoreductase family protein [Conexibacter sp. SYSU D00693]|uniref:NADPH:quinone oxidoreductase family protein n=1 Tax=Conexibacter sp. SYSU D00693 TaxID=2812560 RepID=UPI00196AC272|nr:NADPH:quinone oxidoreductase family protein [Conexibacter sp. SYSU D00693]